MPVTSCKVTTSPSFAFGSGEPLKRPFVGAPPTLGRSFDVAGPGLRFLGLLSGLTDIMTPTSRDEIRVVLNWTEELKARVK